MSIRASRGRERDTLIDLSGSIDRYSQSLWSCTTRKPLSLFPACRSPEKLQWVRKTDRSFHSVTRGLRKISRKPNSRAVNSFLGGKFAIAGETTVSEGNRSFHQSIFAMNLVKTKFASDRFVLKWKIHDRQRNYSERGKPKPKPNLNRSFRRFVCAWFVLQWKIRDLAREIAWSEWRDHFTARFLQNVSWKGNSRAIGSFSSGKFASSFNEEEDLTSKESITCYRNVT